MIRTIIVDDERLARAELRRLLAAHPDIDIIAEAANAADAHALIEQHQPDLLLLDIQMPNGSGFDLLASLDRAPPTIFTTAFDQYAIKAFEVSALDYLLKPIEARRLAHAIARQGAMVNAVANTVKPTTDAARIFIKDGNRCWFVELDKISLFESEGNYTRVFFEAERPLMLRSLLQLEQTLDPEKYLRASRQHIVNLDHIAGMASQDNGGLLLEMRNGANIPVSRRRAARFKNDFRILER